VGPGGVVLEDAYIVRPPVAPRFGAAPEDAGLLGVQPHRRPDEVTASATDFGVSQKIADLKSMPICSLKSLEVARVHRPSPSPASRGRQGVAGAVVDGPAMMIKLLLAEALPAVRANDRVHAIKDPRAELEALIAETIGDDVVTAATAADELVSHG
jgi:hypothetical protein